MKKFYRYTEYSSSETFMSIDEEVYYFINETPCGYWIKHSWDELGKFKRWINKKSHRKFACESKVEAFNSFKARKRQQVRILEGQLRNAKMALRLAEQHRKITPKEFKDFLTKQDCYIGE
jgi:hypothetical protein